MYSYYSIVKMKQEDLRKLELTVSDISFGERDNEFLKHSVITVVFYGCFLSDIGSVQSSNKDTMHIYTELLNTKSKPLPRFLEHCNEGADDRGDAPGVAADFAVVTTDDARVFYRIECNHLIVLQNFI